MENEVKGHKISRLVVTEDRTIESIIRANMFTFEEPRKKYAKAYKVCNCVHMDPYAIFMASSLNLIKLLAGPLNGSNRKPKNIIATNLFKTLSDMRGAMESSVHIDSLALQYAKECSRLLFVAKADIDALCGIDYISNTFFPKVHSELSNTHMALTKWFDILTTHTALKKNHQLAQI